jgi:hypothetical protein
MIDRPIGKTQHDALSRASNPIPPIKTRLGPLSSFGGISASDVICFDFILEPLGQL